MIGIPTIFYKTEKADFLYTIRASVNCEVLTLNSIKYYRSTLKYLTEAVETFVINFVVLNEYKTLITIFSQLQIVTSSYILKSIS